MYVVYSMIFINNSLLAQFTPNIGSSAQKNKKYMTIVGRWKKYPPQIKEEIHLEVRLRIVLRWKQTKKNTTQSKMKTSYCTNNITEVLSCLYDNNNSPTINYDNNNSPTINDDQNMNHSVKTHQYSRVHQVYHILDNLSNRFNNITIHSQVHSHLHNVHLQYNWY